MFSRGFSTCTRANTTDPGRPLPSHAFCYPENYPKVCMPRVFGKPQGPVVCPGMHFGVNHMLPINVTQALPPCGTFDRLVNRALLPAVPQLRTMVESTASQHVPHIPLDWSRSFRHNVTRFLPCRGMCKAVVDTCTCGSQGSMGAALSGLTAGTSGVARDVLQQAIIADESDVDLCDWFSSDDYAGMSETTTQHSLSISPCTCRGVHAAVPHMRRS